MSQRISDRTVQLLLGLKWVQELIPVSQIAGQVFLPELNRSLYRTRAYGSPFYILRQVLMQVFVDWA